MMRTHAGRKADVDDIRGSLPVLGIVSSRVRYLLITQLGYKMILRHQKHKKTKREGKGSKGKGREGKRRKGKAKVCREKVQKPNMIFEVFFEQQNNTMNSATR